MVRDEVFINLNGGDPTLTLVGYPSLAANAHNGIVVMHAVDEVSEGVGLDCGIRIDLRYYRSRQQAIYITCSKRNELTISTTSKKSGVTPINTCIFLNKSKSNGDIRSL